jgi:hypothetical protein
MCYLTVIQLKVAIYNTGKVFYLTILDVYIDGMAMGLFFGFFGLWCVLFRLN